MRPRHSLAYVSTHTQCAYVMDGVPPNLNAVLKLQRHTFKTSNSRCRVLLDKLMVPQPVTKFPTRRSTLRFIAVSPTARHLSLSQIDPFHALPSYFIHFNIILPCTPTSYKWYFPLTFAHQKLRTRCPSVLYMPHQFLSPRFDHPSSV
jgi:hypothetical protein